MTVNELLECLEQISDKNIDVWVDKTTNALSDRHLPRVTLITKQRLSKPEHLDSDIAWNPKEKYLLIY